MKSKSIIALLAMTALLFAAGCSRAADAPDTNAVEHDTETAPVTVKPSETEPKTVPEAPTVVGARIEPAGEEGVLIEKRINASFEAIKEGEKYAFFADSDAAYTYPEPWKNKMTLTFDDGNEFSVDYAFVYMGVTVADLDRVGAEYIKYEKGSAEYGEYYSWYADRMTAAALDEAVWNYPRSGYPLPLEFESGDELCDDDLYCYFRSVLLDFGFNAEISLKYAEYCADMQSYSYEIPIEVYEKDLRARFNVTFADKISVNESMVVPGAITVHPRQGYGEGVAFAEEVSERRLVDGVYVIDCAQNTYAYQDIISVGDGDVFVHVPAITYTLGVRVNDDFSYTYQFCRDLTEHYHTLDDFSAIVPNKSSIDVLLALAPETILTDREKYDGVRYAAYAMGAEPSDGVILVTVNASDMIESVETYY